MSKKSFAVIGVGRFGLALIEELVKLEADVLVIDKNFDKIEKIAKMVTNAVCLDSTDIEALKEIGINNYDTVIVATGMNVDNSILTTLILKDLGVKEVFVKVQSEYHARVVEKLGVSPEHLVWPEQETGKRLATILISGNFLEYLQLDQDYSFISTNVTKKMIGKHLLELDIRRNFGVNIVAVRRNEQIIIPSSQTPFEEGDEILLVGRNDLIEKFTQWLKQKKFLS
ncbi:MAG: potassium transporter Trk [Tenericutes bacterium HGW-Tenericutes-5]|jgi:trk system potassium uptake protein TrkA|nr:MAG: potassium transporter Trk [Tenericutes bacterium HGW-Tenericutes-5]